MGANNTITTASSSSSGAPRRPTSFLTRNTCFSAFRLVLPRIEFEIDTYIRSSLINMALSLSGKGSACVLQYM